MPSKSSSSLKAHISPLSSAFGIPGMDLDCRDKGMLCWEYGIPLHLCLLNQVSGSGSASLVEETEGPVLSVHLVFHRHTVAFANALPHADTDAVLLLQYRFNIYHPSYILTRRMYEGRN